MFQLGEQLTYGFLDVLIEPTAERQRAILENEKLICKCVRCKSPTGENSDLSKEERQRLASDPDFLDVMAFDPYSDGDDGVKVKALNESCITFLNKYKNVKWCDEIAHVIVTFSTFFDKRIEGSVKFT